MKDIWVPVALFKEALIMQHTYNFSLMFHRSNVVIPSYALSS